MQEEASECRNSVIRGQAVCSEASRSRRRHPFWLDFTDNDATLRGWKGAVLPGSPPSQSSPAGLDCLLTFIAAAGAHAGLEVLGVRTGDAEVQLGLQHALPHPLALFTSGRAAGRPWGPVGVDAGFRGVICKEGVTCSPWEPVEATTWLLA